MCIGTRKMGGGCEMLFMHFTGEVRTLVGREDILAGSDLVLSLDLGCSYELSYEGVMDLWLDCVYKVLTNREM